MRYQLLIYFALLAYFIKLLFVFFTFSSLSFYAESGRSSVYFFVDLNVNINTDNDLFVGCLSTSATKA